MNQGLFKYVWQRPLGKCILILLLTLYLATALGPWLAPYAPSRQSLEHSFHPPMVLGFKGGRLGTYNYELKDALTKSYKANKDAFLPLTFWAKGDPYELWGFIKCDRHLFGLAEEEHSAERFYLLGADGNGRDVFSRLLYGAQISLSIGLIGVVITLVLGFFIGALSGFIGGKFDFIAMRLVELIMAIPGLYLLLGLRSALAPYFKSSEIYFAIIVILSFIGWAGASRVIRGLSLSLKEQTYVIVAQSMGQSTYKILTKHFLPNVMNYLLVSATLSIPGYILGEAALSFLGLGIQEPDASWGLMLKQAQDIKVFMLGFWWLLTPGLCIFIIVVAFNILGDLLRDAADPKHSR